MPSSNIHRVRCIMCDNCARSNIAILSALLAATAAAPFPLLHADAKHVVDLPTIQPLFVDMLACVAVSDDDLAAKKPTIELMNTRLDEASAELLGDMGRIAQSATSLFGMLHSRIATVLAERTLRGDLEASGEISPENALRHVIESKIAEFGISGEAVIIDTRDGQQRRGRAGRIDPSMLN